jgi:hypothetical protein
MENIQEHPANKVYREVAQTISRLYRDWCPQADTKNVNQYEDEIRPIVESFGAEFCKMVKRPFGFTYKVGDQKYQVTKNDSFYSYKPVKR